MKILPWNKQAANVVNETLKQGGVIAHPADTCFGLAADLLNSKALKCLQEIKGRDANKPMSIMFHVTQKEELDKYVTLDEFGKFVANELLPGPVTLLYPKGPSVPDWFFPDTDLIGIRIPYEDMTQDILMNFKGPLITTSANLSNKDPISTSNEAIQVFEESICPPDIIIEGEIKNSCLPSTVLLVQNESVKIMRKGPMNKAQLERILGVDVNNNDNN